MNRRDLRHAAISGLGESSYWQPGSSIITGQINPVIAGATMMVCAQVIGNDAASLGAQHGNFRLM